MSINLFFPPFRLFQDGRRVSGLVPREQKHPPPLLPRSRAPSSSPVLSCFSARDEKTRNTRKKGKIPDTIVRYSARRNGAISWDAVKFNCYSLGNANSPRRNSATGPGDVRNELSARVGSVRILGKRSRRNLRTRGRLVFSDADLQPWRAYFPLSRRSGGRWTVNVSDSVDYRSADRKFL